MVGKPNRWAQMLPTQDQAGEMLFSAGGIYTQLKDGRLFGPTNDAVAALKTMVRAVAQQNSGASR